MQAAEHSLLALVAPRLLPVDAAATAFEGYLALTASRELPSSLWLRVSGLQPGAASLAGAQLEVNAELAALLEGHADVVAQRLAGSVSLAAFCVELQSVVDQLSLERPPSAGASRPAAFYSSLRRELDALGWSSVRALSDDLSQLTLAAADVAGRRHELRITLPPAYPAAPPCAAADLPTPLELCWGPGAGLADVLAQFEAALQRHQQLWNTLDDLDERAWVIEPSPAPRSVLYRRVALGAHVSLALTLDPAQAAALPLDLRFMGSDAAVAPLRQRLHANRALWQPGLLLRHNLEAVLELELPRRQVAGLEDASADCAICYAYRLPPQAGQVAGGGEGDVPDINCDNAACGKPFHRNCLCEWLSADTATRQSFNTLFGACPYCSAPITVKVA